jgi:hypothetical protein
VSEHLLLILPFFIGGGVALHERLVGNTIWLPFVGQHASKFSQCVLDAIVCQEAILTAKKVIPREMIVTTQVSWVADACGMLFCGSGCAILAQLPDRTRSSVAFYVLLHSMEGGMILYE